MSFQRNYRDMKAMMAIMEHHPGALRDALTDGPWES